MFCRQRDIDLPPVVVSLRLLRDAAACRRHSFVRLLRRLRRHRHRRNSADSAARFLTRALPLTLSFVARGPQQRQVQPPRMLQRQSSATQAACCFAAKRRRPCHRHRRRRCCRCVSGLKAVAETGDAMTRQYDCITACRLVAISRPSVGRTGVWLLLLLLPAVAFVVSAIALVCCSAPLPSSATAHAARAQPVELQ